MVQWQKIKRILNMKKSILVGVFLVGSLAFAKTDYFVGAGKGNIDAKFNVKTSTETYHERDDANFISVYGGEIIDNTHKISAGFSTYDNSDNVDSNSFSLKYSYFLSKEQFKPFIGVTVFRFDYKADLDNSWEENKLKMTTDAGLFHFGFDYDFSKHHSISAGYEISFYTNSDSDTVHYKNDDERVEVKLSMEDITLWSINYQYKF